ncbi:MAG: hypothetical protein IKI58_10320 [Oscillospiraceae bacterium]|nr:hypothetical protein [Oscillospiraceae bacterium]
MKLRKLFAFLSAGVLCCCALGGTAFAEETEPAAPQEYQLGDITMDGEINIDDAQLALRVYTWMLSHVDPVQKHFVTEEQLALGNVDGIESNVNGITSPIDLDDATFILYYYTDALAYKTEGMNIEEYIALYDAKMQSETE